jgi:hypothetical protein
MNDTISLKGQCLCGAVKNKLTELKPNIDVCHCRVCRVWGGGPFMSLDAGQKIETSGAQSIAVYDSSDWAERAFCKQCGSHLYYRLKHNNAHHVLVGLFDMDDKLKLENQIFIDEKPNFYNFAEQSIKMTGAEFFAMVAGEDEP